MRLQLADAAIMPGNVGAAPARGNQNLPQLAPLDLNYIKSEAANAAQFYGTIDAWHTGPLRETWWQRTLPLNTYLSPASDSKSALLGASSGLSGGLPLGCMGLIICSTAIAWQSFG